MPLTEIPFNLAGRVFRSPMPFGPGDPEGKLFRRYQDAGVEAVILLIEDEESLRRTGRDLKSFYQGEGLVVIHLPIADFGVPEAEHLREALAAADHLVRNGKTIAVHCNAGIGRTGLFLSCLAKQVFGFSAEDAVAWVRRYIPDAVEVPAQMKLVDEC